jgi:hypothetical protein
MTAERKSTLAGEGSGAALRRRQRTKNRALFAALLAFALLVYLIAIVRMGGG